MLIIIKIRSLNQKSVQQIYIQTLKNIQVITYRISI